VCPATAYLNWWGLAVCTGWAEWAITPEPTLDSIGELFASWDAPWPLYQSNLSQAATMAMAIQHNDAWACADGSYMPGLSTLMATAAWRIEPKSIRDFVCRGETPVSGLLKEINPY
jgi:hypothetical protein